MGEVSDLICIVDDDASVRRALGRMVRSFGFDVQLLASGRDCLDGPYVDQASCLIVDVMMPNMDGFELHALLAASDRDIPTIFISGQNDEKDFDRATSVGCVAILNKPCDANSLHDAIEKAIAM
jgi:FixJ family two-component response regulator